MSDDYSLGLNSDLHPLGEFLDIIKERREGPLPIYSVTLRDGMQRRDGLGRIIQSDLNNEDNLFAAKNDICYNMMRMWQGASGIAPEDCLVSPAYVVCRPKEDLHPSFAAHLLKSEQAKKSFVDRSQGVTSDRWRLYPEEFLKIRLPIPPLPEQKKIAEILSGIDNAIGGVQRKIEKLRSARVALVESELRGDRQSIHTDTEIGVIPSHWKVKGILEVSSVASGQVDPTTKDYQDMILIAPNHIESGTGKVIGTETAIQQGAISGKYFAKKGSVILSKIRPNLAKVCMADHDCLTSADMYPITAGHDITPGYLKQVLLSKRFTQYATESSVRGNIPKINRDELSGYKFAMPPLNEQEAIVSTIESVEQTISMEESRVCLLLALKNSLSSDLLSGRKRVSI